MNLPAGQKLRRLGAERFSSSRSASARAQVPSDVGRVGDLFYAFERRGRRTCLTGSRCSTPWHFIPPMELDESGCVYTLLVNPSGGLVGGDVLTLKGEIGREAHVLFSTPSANRIYRSLGEEAIQHVELHVASGGIVEWMPECTIPFAGSRFRQTIHVSLEPGATALVWDAVASGRIARGERWQFESFANEIRIEPAGGTSVIERYELQAGQGRRGIGLAGEWNYVASLFVIGDGISPDRRDGLENRIADYLVEQKGNVLGGVSSLASGGLAVKILTRAAPDLASVQQELWRMIRQDLWGVSAVALRKY